MKSDYNKPLLQEGLPLPDVVAFKGFKVEVKSSSSGFKDDINSLAVIGIVTFVGDAARGILFPALWPLCQHLGGSKVDLGWLVAIFSIGRMLVATPFGKLSDIYRHKRVLIWSGVVLTFGAILWSSVDVFGGLPALYVAQFIMGVGSGTLGVTRSYVVEQTSSAKRTFMLARLSALQYAGFAATPLTGAGLVVAGAGIGPSWTYALPAFLVVFITLLSLCGIIFVFRDFAAEDIESDLNRPTSAPTSHSDSNRVDNASLHVEEGPQLGSLGESEMAAVPEKADENLTATPESDMMKIYTLMMLLNFTTRGGIAVFETQGSQILLDQYDVPELYLGLIVSIGGIIGTINLLYFKQFWTKNFSDITLMVSGVGAMAIVEFLVINWTPTEMRIIWRFVIPLLFMYGIAYPVGNSAVLGMFSMLQKKGRQAQAQGTFALMGSAARVLLPILSGYLETYVKQTSSFALVQFMMAASVVLILINYNKIVFYSVGTGSSKDPLGWRNKSLIAFFCVVGLAGIIGMSF